MTDYNIDHPEWHAQAACVGHLDVMFNAALENTARKLCESCPVKRACRIETDEQEAHMIQSRGFIYGMRAEETPLQRIRRRTGRRGVRGRPPKAEAWSDEELAQELAAALIRMDLYAYRRAS